MGTGGQLETPLLGNYQEAQRAARAGLLSAPALSPSTPRCQHHSTQDLKWLEAGCLPREVNLLLGHSEKGPLSGPSRQRKLSPPQDWDLASFSPNHCGLKGNFESALRAQEKGLLCPGELVSGGLPGMVPGGDVVEDPCSRHRGHLGEK